ncbi:MAG TPA: baseplate J/gp47 family protein, partial [Anaerolineae bacterium]|nr:baseplate J/gp47 family protein [Anaerolineae bacterium]
MSEAEVVYLNPDDTFAVIRERLRAAQGDRIVLVVPKECPGLDSLVDLKLLARQIAALDKEVALVSTRRELRELARSLGFRTFSSTAWARRTKWPLRKKGLQPAARTSMTRESLARSIPTPVASGAVGVGGMVVLAAAFVGMLAFMGLLVVVFVPTAKVTLLPVVYPVSTTLTVVASPDLEAIDFVNVRVPARRAELEVVGSDEIATTALRDEPDARATGEVVLTNRRSEATTVMSDTVVTTSGGTTVRFRTTEEVTLPPGVGGRARAPIEAIEPGPTGNVAAYSINRVEGAMDRQVNVINVAPTEGGGMSQVAYVTAADKDQLRESSLHKLKEEGYYT